MTHDPPPPPAGLQSSGAPSNRARSSSARSSSTRPSVSEPTSAERIRAYRGPALFSYGFRPFFLSAAVWAALVLPAWLLMLAGRLSLPTALTPLEWHVHELVFGYVPAVVAGFLLTSVPNWTGRLPIVGRRLALLYGVWVAGRVAMLTSIWLGAETAALIDLLFLATLGAAIGREIVAAGNTRNLKVLVVIGLLLGANLLFHLEAIGGIGGGHGTRLGIGATVFLICLIGGRIIPSFTRNWLARRAPGRLPAPFDRFDGAVMAITGAALAGWVVAPQARLVAGLAALACLANIARLARWAGERTVAEPLVLVLHVAYAFVPLGFVLLAVTGLAPGIVTMTGALHAWTVGAIALMTLAVMTRASLGHTGQPLTATRPIQAIYLAIVVAAVARVANAFGLGGMAMLHLAATAWLLAFAGFVVVFGPLLTRPRP